MTSIVAASSLLTALDLRFSLLQRRLLEAIGSAAEAAGADAWLVGGAVRDLLRPDLPTRDGVGELDLAIEGNAATVAALVAERSGAELVQHERFHTASLRLDGVRLDLARARRERYSRAGALPEVAPASIEVDLGRRDFTVNAMALCLSGSRRGELLDPYAGRHDLERGLIRVLHDGSFRDDPTRLIRACRYAARIQGRLASGTARQARGSLHHLGALSGERFGEALRRLLTDPAADGALRRATRLRLPQARVEGWSVSASVVDALGDADSARPGPFWALMGLTLKPDVSAQLPRACGLTGSERGLLEDGAALRGKRRRLGRRDLRDSAGASLLRPHDPTAVAAAACVWRGRADRRAATMPRWRELRSPLNADRLAELNVSPGPQIGAWLVRLRDAVIDGELAEGAMGHAEAERLVQRVQSARRE